MGKICQGNIDEELGREIQLPIFSAQDCIKAGKRWRIASCLLCAVLVYNVWQITLRLYDEEYEHHRYSRKINVILMISDGYGPASETFGRSFHQALHSNTLPNAQYQTPLDKLLVGSHRSRSIDSLITDSAAGATAFSCGIKSYNGAIGVDAKGKACGNIFEGAKEKGMLTGVVVTSRLTDATPACFVAHVPSRAQESLIASQSLGLSENGTRVNSFTPLDLAIGGGGCLFLPRTDPFSCRKDDVDLVSRSIEDGWNTQLLFGKGTSSIEKVGKLPLLRLLAPSNTPYEIDRLPSQPDLSTLAMQAVETLYEAPENKRGFLLMIEGSQIDLCAHQNDPACHAREIEAYQLAIENVSNWVEKKNKGGEKTILISTSDHETAGLTLGRQLSPDYPNYAYYPNRLIDVKGSATAVSMQLLRYARKSPKPNNENILKYIRNDILITKVGFTERNGGLPSDDEVQHLNACLQTADADLTDDPPIDTGDLCRIILADLISRRAEVGWSTSGHTGVDVPVHVLGSKSLRGNIENTEIGHFIAKTLSIDLEGVTRRVQGRLNQKFRDDVKSHDGADRKTRN